MIINYQIDANDFLQYQLYTASKSERIKKKRFRSRILIPLIYALPILFYLYSKDFKGAVVFLVLGLLWFFLYPFWESWYYVRHYKGFIEENYRDRFNRDVAIEINNDFISAKDSGSESKIRTSEIEEITEIHASIFIKIKSGVSLILPKDKIENIESLISILKELSNILNIKYNIENAWKWK